MVAVGFTRRGVALHSLLFSVVMALLPVPALGVQKVTLAWQASPDPDVTSYKVYYGMASGRYTAIVPVSNTTSATISGLQEGATYYFAVTACDCSGLESVPSNEVSYTVPGVVLALEPIRAGGFPKAFLITSAGVTPSPWALEASQDGNVWRTVTTGTNSSVRVVAVVSSAPAMLFRLSSGEAGVRLALQRNQPDEFPDSFRLTAAGASPGQWTLEARTDSQPWSTLAGGTNTPVNAALVVSTTPTMFFRLKGL